MWKVDETCAKIGVEVTEKTADTFAGGAETLIADCTWSMGDGATRRGGWKV